MSTKTGLSRLLTRGAIGEIAVQLGLAHSTVTIAIRKGRPTHPAVQEALRRIEASGVVAATEKLAALAALPTA